MIEARLEELRQMRDAPADGYSAAEWCKAANELVAICDAFQSDIRFFASRLDEMETRYINAKNRGDALAKERDALREALNAIYETPGPPAKVQAIARRMATNFSCALCGAKVVIVAAGDPPTVACPNGCTSEKLMASIDRIAAEELARAFHEVYESLAPAFGYETRNESAVPWEQVPENNRRLMVAVCGVLLDRFRASRG